MNALKARGHTFAEINRTLGRVQGVMIEKETGLRLGASDPRNPNGRAAGY